MNDYSTIYQPNWPHLFLVVGLTVVSLFVGLIVIGILHGLINTMLYNYRKKPFRKNEINAEQYGKLHKLASATPALMHRLAKELNQKKIFTGADYERIKDELSKELKALKIQKNQEAKEAIKAAIKLETINSNKPRPMDEHWKFTNKESSVSEANKYLNDEASYDK